jgi:hypothetical protein
MSLRSRWAVVAIVGTAACSGASAAHDVGSDASVDAANDSRGTTPRPDASRDARSGDDARSANDASSDAGHMHDATGPGTDAPQEDAPSPRDAGVDAPPACATKAADEATGVFLVGSTTPTTGSCGTLANPCTDLASAIAATTSMKSTIYIGPGTYAPVAPATSFTVPDGVTLSGGWTVTTGGAAAVFTATCTSNAIITATSGGTVIAAGGATGTGKVELDALSVTYTGVPTAGQSVYGILATGGAGSSLVLNDVTVAVPSAGAGAAGPDLTGIAGAAGGCAPGGANGTTGQAGAAGGPVQYSATGAAPEPGSAGTAGSNGDTGNIGEDACTAQGGAGTCVHGGTVVQGTCTVGPNTAACTAAPMGGCGGNGGQGGPGGGGGGSSIGVFTWGRNLTVQSGAITGGNGGAGGAGGTSTGGFGAGGQAAAAVTLTYPAPGSACDCVGTVVVTCSACRPGTPETLTAVTSGGTGANGGAGGQGGGGAGGDSYAYYVGGSATATLVQSPALTAGTGGAGGAPGGPAGKQGSTN